MSVSVLIPYKAEGVCRLKLWNVSLLQASSFLSLPVCLSWWRRAPSPWNCYRLNKVPEPVLLWHKSARLFGKEIAIYIIDRHTFTPANFISCSDERAQIFQWLASHLLCHFFLPSASAKVETLRSPSTGTAWTHCLRDKTTAQRRCHQCADRHTACRLAHNRYMIGVAAKGCYYLHPFDGCRLVHKP